LPGIKIQEDATLELNNAPRTEPPTEGRMEQDFTKISSNPIACTKIDSPDSIRDLSSKGLKRKKWPRRTEAVALGKPKVHNG